MNVAAPSYVVTPQTVLKVIALKVQRRKFCTAAHEEVYVYDVLRSEGISDPAIIELHEVFAHEGHVCMAFELHGKELDGLVPRTGMHGDEVKGIARQLLGALRTLHAEGFVHSDIKPENVLYDSETGVAKLIDMSTADRHFGVGARVATREFTPPEIVLGMDELGPPMDIWSLACALFYLLSGTLVFHPHKVVREKYVEFAEGWKDENNEFEIESGDDSEIFPDAPLAAGDLLGGKYRLVSVLGKGTFGTVWRCQPEHDQPLRDQTWKELQDAEKVVLEGTGDTGLTLSEAEEEAENESETVDMYDLVLNFEMLVQMEERLGAFEGFGTGGVYHDLYFRADGTYKFPADPQPLGMAAMLTERTGMSPEDARGWEAFFRKMLRYKPSERVTAAECLADPWLA